MTPITIKSLDELREGDVLKFTENGGPGKVWTLAQKLFDWTMWDDEGGNKNTRSLAWVAHRITYGAILTRDGIPLVLEDEK